MRHRAILTSKRCMYAVAVLFALYYLALGAAYAGAWAGLGISMWLGR